MGEKRNNQKKMSESSNGVKIPSKDIMLVLAGVHMSGCTLNIILPCWCIYIQQDNYVYKMYAPTYLCWHTRGCTLEYLWATFLYPLDQHAYSTSITPVLVWGCAAKCGAHWVTCRAVKVKEWLDQTIMVNNSPACLCLLHKRMSSSAGHRLVADRLRHLLQGARVWIGGCECCWSASKRNRTGGNLNARDSTFSNWWRGTLWSLGRFPDRFEAVLTVFGRFDGPKRHCALHGTVRPVRNVES